MDKKLLSLAVAAGLASSSASAINLDTGVGSNSYATENVISSIAPGTALTEANANNVTVAAGFTVSTTPKYMRFDLTGATLGAAAVTADLVGTETIIANGTAGAGAVETLSAGGAVGDTYAIFEIKANAALNQVTSANTVAFDMPELDVVAQGTIGVTYTLHSTAVEAVNNSSTTALATKTGSIASFTAGTTTAVAITSTTTPAPTKIDPANNNLSFVGGLATTNIGIFTLANVGTNQMAIDGTTDVTHTVKQSANSLVVTGDFSATQDLTLGVPDGTYTLASVFIDHTATNTVFDCDNSNTASSALSATSATIALPTAADTYAVCVTTNGVSTINEGSYSAVLTPTATSIAYSAPAVSLTLGSLVKDGSTALLNLALSPTGAYPSFVRITNTSAVAGDVSITLINDDGDSEVFSLSAVSGQSSDSLAALGSTTLISVADLMAAAQAVDATFALGANSNKLRVSITGEFGGIAAQSVTTSIDGNSFSTF